jgi:hypothetical protein
MERSLDIKVSEHRVPGTGSRKRMKCNMEIPKIVYCVIGLSSASRHYCSVLQKSLWAQVSISKVTHCVSLLSPIVSLSHKPVEPQQRTSGHLTGKWTR